MILLFLTNILTECLFCARHCTKCFYAFHPYWNLRDKYDPHLEMIRQKVSKVTRLAEELS